MSHPFLLQRLSDLGRIDVLPYPNCGSREGVEQMGSLVNILVSVVANVIGHCICKWLDRHDRGR